MAILTSALAALLIFAGLAALAMSVDLIPTEVGLCYGVSGVILLSAGAIVLAVALLIVRLDRIAAPKPAPAVEPLAPPAPHEVGRYVVRGTEYAIFSDGAIEAETGQGRRRFGSMAEFRAYVEARGAEAEAD
jgi:hypothetical protein